MRWRRPRFAAWMAVLGLVAACDEGGAAAQRRCRFGSEQIVARSLALELDDLALVATAQGAALALWSEPTGLMARALDPHGAPRAAAVRIGRRCGGGLSATATRRHVEIACLETDFDMPAVKGGLPGASLRWDRVDLAGALIHSQPVAPVGHLSAGVAIASGPSRADPAGPWVAWQDASADRRVVQVARLQRGEAAVPVRLSSAGRAAGRPALVVDAAGLLLVWPETYLQAGRPRAELLAFRRPAAHAAWPPADGGGAGPEPLLPVHHEAARPQLMSGSRFGRVLAFRDQPRRGQRTGLFVTALSRPGRLPVPHRVARADGDARPALCECGDRLFTATPRTYAGDYFVGLNVLDRELDRAAPEQQFYQDAHAFSQAATACVDGRALILIGERARMSQGVSALRAVPVVCDRPLAAKRATPHRFPSGPG